jgi:hypothetical protein
VMPDGTLGYQPLATRLVGTREGFVPWMDAPLELRQAVLGNPSTLIESSKYPSDALLAAMATEPPKRGKKLPAEPRPPVRFVGKRLKPPAS